MARRRESLSSQLAAQQNPDAALLVGGPANPVNTVMGEPIVDQETPETTPEIAPETPETPASVTVRLGSLDVSVPADQAEGLRRAYEDQLTRTQQLEALVLRNAQPVTAAPAPAPAEPAIDYGLELFSKPNEVLARLRSEAVAQAKAEFAPMREQIERMQQQSAIQKFYGDFYEANKDLRGSEFIVEAVASKHLDRLKGMSVDGARDELARLSRQAELDVMKRRAVTTPATPQRTVLESASPVSSRAAAAPAATALPSLSGTIVKRRAARRQAANRLTAH